MLFRKTQFEIVRLPKFRTPPPFVTLFRPWAIVTPEIQLVPRHVKIPTRLLPLMVSRPGPGPRMEVLLVKSGRGCDSEMTPVPIENTIRPPPLCAASANALRNEPAPESLRVVTQNSAPIEPPAMSHTIKKSQAPLHRTRRRERQPVIATEHSHDPSCVGAAECSSKPPQFDILWHRMVDIYPEHLAMASQFSSSSPEHLDAVVAQNQGRTQIEI
ncbi:MAG: hypothetical protein HZA90_05470 [Verrucomicrobia bacterium]|nr:hypothetical protein [Verrucomicrobiota bacterium]